MRTITLVNAFLLSASVFLLSACNLGNSSGDTHAQLPGPGELGAIQIRMMRAPTEAEGDVFVSGIVLDDPSTVRIAIINRNTGFRVVEDYPVPATVDAIIPVPVGQGYEVHGISFVTDDDLNSNDVYILLKHAMLDDVPVTLNETTFISLILDQIDAGLEYPESVEGGEQFVVQIDNHPALRGFGYVYAQTDPIDTRYVDYTEFGVGSVTLNAPNASEPSELYLISRRYLNSDLTMSSDIEGGLRYRYYAPDVNREAEQASLALEPPSGNIGIEIVY